MARDTQERRAALRARLIGAARAAIEEGGLESLRARELAAGAECSVGAIYNAFGDLGGLAAAANGETFRELGAHVSRAVEAAGAQPPTERLVTMSLAYLDYARAHPRRWRALFDLPVRRGAVPDWYVAALDGVLGLIDAPLAEAFPDLPPDAVRLRTRALFSSVHGMVLLGVEDRVSGVEDARLPEMIRFVLEAATRRDVT